MLVSTNVIAVPKGTVPNDFEANGLTYNYRVLFELNQADLAVEVITCSDDMKYAYVSPEDFNDPQTQMLITNSIVNFLQDLKLIDTQNIGEKTDSVEQSAEEVISTEEKID